MEKKKLLLHVCCGPCSTHVVERLKEEFDLTLYFYNPSIYPKDEYDKRLDAAKKIAESHGLELLEGEYDHDAWLRIAGGLADEPEGGERCRLCMGERLERTAKKAKEMEIDIFATTLSISPHKNAEAINQMGKFISLKNEVGYLVADFKKNDGFRKSVELSKKYGLYRQDHCGCEFSKE